MKTNQYVGKRSGFMNMEQEYSTRGPWTVIFGPRFRICFVESRVSHILNS